MTQRSKQVQKSLIEFIYDQLVDAFVYFSTPRAIDWNQLASNEKKYQKLAHAFALRDVNEALVLQYGGNRETILGLTFKDFFGMKFEENREAFMRLIQNESVFSEFCLKRKDGSELWIEGHYQLVKNDRDKTIGVLGIQHDITSRKRTEEEIVKLSIALDQSANEIIITRRNGEIEYVNRSFTAVTGYSPREVMGKNPRILKSGAHPPEFYSDLWKTLIQGSQWAGEFQNRKKNGELYWESATITPIRNKDNEIIRFIAIKEDITMRKKAEQSLIDSEEKFRSMVSNLPGVVYRCAYDSSWTIFFVSDTIEQLTGFAAKDFHDNRLISFAGIIHPEDRPKVAETVQSGILHAEQFNVEYRIMSKDNSVKWVSNSGRPVFNDDHSIKWLDGFLFDITERVMVLEELKKAKIAAEEANRAKSEFLANISHEIRTPLNSVLGFTELLERMTVDETQVKYLNSIKSSGKNLMMLINDLLDLSKIEAGKMTLYFTFFDIRQLLDEIKNVFSLRVAVKGIAYIEDVKGNFPAEIKFDETRLRQVLINLVGNAVKFTHEGEIRIEVRANLKREKTGTGRIKLEIKVIDTGIGIPEDSFRMIFESFRQQSQLDSRKYGGTGLGLAITRRLVEAMNGTISLESKVGKGTTFKVVFPDVEYNETPSDKYAAEMLRKDSPERIRSHLPFDIKEKNEAYVSGDYPGRNILKNSEYQLLMKRFDQELAEQWKMFESKQPLKEIQLFAKEIITLGKSFNLYFILDYGEQLLSTIENFDIEEMRMKLDYFPDLLKQLKKIGHEIG
jgi:PAS domain S-box-containing protein